VLISPSLRKQGIGDDQLEELHLEVSFSKDLKVIVNLKKHLPCRVSYSFIFNLQDLSSQMPGLYKIVN
jgi:hypothetical protein